jgi:hypothetical protein
MGVFNNGGCDYMIKKSWNREFGFDAFGGNSTHS